jgi:hypothetical protein
MQNNEVVIELKMTETSLSSSRESKDNCNSPSKISKPEIGSDQLQSGYTMKMPYFCKSRAKPRIIRPSKDKVIFTEQAPVRQTD